jgi:hypothetical protein
MDERAGDAIADGMNLAFRQLRTAPRRLFERWVQRLPLGFRVLYRQFLLRVIDLEALSIQADVVGFLGQFAGLLIFYSLIQAIGAFFSTLGPPPTPQALQLVAWHTEHASIEIVMLVVGLITVVSWDATFPDRRDVMVLSPLPVAPHTILFAKIAASAAILGIAILALNCASSFAWSLVLGGIPGALRFFPAWWFTMIASGAFLYCSVLTVQGFSALLLPRRIFLRLSAILQLAAFGLFLGVYFLEPSVIAPGIFASAENHWVLASSPSYWFFALFNQLNGTLPSELAWLAARAWIGLGIVLCGAAASLLLCYMRTMKKTVEEPDLVPGAAGLHWTPRFGSALETALVLFSFRSLTRSRQHRLILAFYFSVVFGIALSLLRGELSPPALRPLTPDFLIPTILMMTFAVIGLRNVFSLPISLTANWILRIAQLCPSEKYIAAARRVQLLFGVLPVWLVAACLALSFRPWNQVLEHLAVLALLGWLFTECSLIGFYKVPFTCSYLPGKSNIQVGFFGLIVVLLMLAISFAPFEQSTLAEPGRFAGLCFALVAAASGLWIFNRHRAKSAVLYFEELPEQLILTLGLISGPPPRNPEAG